ncbi:hypothetical protein STEG23_019930 [Scotinomys teguina]
MIGEVGWTHDDSSAKLSLMCIDLHTDAHKYPKKIGGPGKERYSEIDDNLKRVDKSRWQGQGIRTADTINKGDLGEMAKDSATKERFIIAKDYQDAHCDQSPRPSKAEVKP